MQAQLEQHPQKGHAQCQEDSLCSHENEKGALLKHAGFLFDTAANCCAFLSRQGMVVMDISGSK